MARFITRYTVPDGEACAQDILEADAACSKNACECNSFYLDLYMDDRLLTACGHCAGQLGWCWRRPISASSAHLRKGHSVLESHPVDEQARSYCKPVQLHFKGAGCFGDTRSVNCRADPRIAGACNGLLLRPRTMPTLDELRDAFVELDPDHGLHARRAARWHIES